MRSVSEIYARHLCERFWKRLSNCIQRWYKGGCYKTPCGQTVVPATHIFCLAVARLFTESLEAISHIFQTQSAIGFEFTFCKRNIFMWMGFIETLVPATPALIEKNKTKRIINKCIYPSHRVPLCARTPAFDVEPAWFQNKKPAAYLRRVYSTLISLVHMALMQYV